MISEPVAEAATERPDGPPGIPEGERGPVVFLVAAALLAAVFLSTSVLFFWIENSRHPPIVSPRVDPVADLLSWIPDNEMTEHAFAAWTPDRGAAPARGSSELQEKLSLEPFPRTLGHSVEWEQRFGWQVGLVTGWAVAGSDRELAILDGDFDIPLIKERLVAAGYSITVDRGVSIYTIDAESWVGTSPGSDFAQSARVVAILDGRLITSASLELVKASIDVALDGEGSLSDEESVSAALQTMAPLSAVVGIDQSVHAAACLPGSTVQTPGGDPASQYVFIGYGRLGEGGDRRTLVTVSYPDAPAASAHLVEYQNGWVEGFANAGGAGGSVRSYGTLTNVSQSGRFLIAELMDGRDEGWVRAGIRFAIPVCESSMAYAPPATPDATRGQSSLSTVERLVASLPALVQDERQVVVDLEALSVDAGVIPPGGGATEAEIAAWETEIEPLPGFMLFQTDPAQLKTWTEFIGVPISAIRGLGEFSTSDNVAVGVLIGTWDLPALTAVLSKRGYEWIDVGDVRHFAYVGLDAESVLPDPAWSNIAVYGDRMWLSENQQRMRDVVELATSQ